MLKLPDKLSALLKLALHDLSLCERSKKYQIDMQYYHCPMDNICFVCLAGTVMAKTLKTPLDCFVHPNDLSIDLGKKLDAIDSCRLGDVEDALSVLKLKTTIKNRLICNYHEDKRQFKKDMRKLIKDLEAVNA